MQQLNPTEISEIIKQRIERLDISTQARNEGTIVSVSSCVASASIPATWAPRARVTGWRPSIR